MRTVSTTLLQIICEILSHSKVIFKSMIGTDEAETTLVKWVKMCTYSGQVSWIIDRYMWDELETPLWNILSIYGHMTLTS